jgi:hypothetical protein
MCLMFMTLIRQTVKTKLNNEHLKPNILIKTVMKMYQEKFQLKKIKKKY